MPHQVLGITAARGGSKGVPNKNLRLVAGKPLIVWTIEQAKLAGNLDYYIVLTDSSDIARVAQDAGAAVVNEPAHLATDHSPIIDALLYGLDWAEKFYEVPFEIVADLRATNPMKTAADIDGAISKLIRTGADCVCSVSRLDDHHPSRIKMIFEDRLVPVWPEDPAGLRQDLDPPVYIRNGGIYIARASSLREAIFFLGGTTRPWLMEQPNINIDTELDVLAAEAVLQSGLGR